MPARNDDLSIPLYELAHGDTRAWGINLGERVERSADLSLLAKEQMQW